ncbi:hypothetical protein BJY01DRAFT_245154 [Aspergillus pseudoustus]|uniref:NodB homology domain-containing protein n=1 Tax=Aspergillus pseudoustus TaxID=1810923 RepID=A0ABR4KIC2_9EURO
MAAIRDAGHEIGLHGYTHEYPGDLTTQQFRDIMIKSKEIVSKFCGKEPKGFIAPAWDPHPEQISIMEEVGLTYADHSMMHEDFHCYYAPKDGEKHVTTNLAKG